MPFSTGSKDTRHSRTRLAEALLDSVAQAELEPLVKEWVKRMKGTNAALDAAIARLERTLEITERRVPR